MPDQSALFPLHASYTASLDDDHFFLQENESLWRALGQAACWEEVEDYYLAELQKESKPLSK